MHLKYVTWIATAGIVFITLMWLFKTTILMKSTRSVHITWIPLKYKSGNTPQSYVSTDLPDLPSKFPPDSETPVFESQLSDTIFFYFWWPNALVLVQAHLKHAKRNMAISFQMKVLPLETSNRYLILLH